jgi:hypothetical protein
VTDRCRQQLDHDNVNEGRKSPNARRSIHPSFIFILAIFALPHFFSFLIPLYLGGIIIIGFLPSSKSFGLHCFLPHLPLILLRQLGFLNFMSLLLILLVICVDGQWPRWG